MRNCEQTVYVDADACPVKEEIVSICRKYKKTVVFVASYAHSLDRLEGSTIVMVDSRMEEVDLYIINHCKRGDIVVTQDHGLASLLLPKGIKVISPRGKQFLNEDIDELLLARYLGKMQRRAGMKTKGPTKFTKEDNLKFVEKFEKILSNVEGI
ncbi:YaiI/YqxD family protein [Anaerobacillus sp. CMMVII]|uniref:YaiI/YqxD family protein n=1 Tax=Anaerobacillus sp. CMMVII TaxID=2755588 RepID=UPI0021B70EBF|nr:YaiI/YqxD family protein [Anaerobacillus sp. CMMVII]MCT8139693.1 YaiI/YqxD family protein [Anaerobacillus sp. CMMVII]